MSDLYLWRAHYSDGTYFDEYDETGQSRGFAAVDQSRLLGIELRSQVVGTPDAFLRIPEDARPIFVRRRHIIGQVDAEQFHETIRQTNTIIGWQKTIQGRNVKALTVFMWDGSVFITDSDEGI